MIDSHAHLHHAQLADQLDAVISRFVDAGGTTILNNAIDLESCHIVLEQARKFEQIFPALGLQPEITTPGSDIYISTISEAWIEKNVSELRKLIEKNKAVVAVGEIGLDYYWVKKERIPNPDKIFELQRKMFRLQVELAAERRMPVVIHCRDEDGDKQAEAEALEIIAKIGNSSITGIFHSYTGSLSYLEDILNLGFYVSFNAIVTYRSADNVRALLDAVPVERLLIESDAPFLVPQKCRSAGIKIGEPAFVDEVAEFIAKRKQISEESLWDSVEQNFQKLLRL